jgi:drug/metabolite transporter (DMT)-like permease
MGENSSRYLAWVFLIALAVVWGSSFILIKKGLFAADGTPVYSSDQVAALRLAFAGIVLLPLVIPAFRSIPRHKIVWMVFVGMIGNGIPAFLFTAAQTHLDSGFAGMLNSLTPLFTVIIGLALFQTRVRRIQIFGVILGLIGACSLIVLQNGIQGASSLNHALLIVVATVCYATSVNVIRNKLSDVKPEIIAGMALMFAGIPSVCYLFFTDFLEVIETNAHAWQSMGYVALLGVLGTALALALFNRLIHMTSPVFASSVTYLIPLVALMWGVLDGEEVKWMHLVLSGVMLCGIYMINLRKGS